MSTYAEQPFTEFEERYFLAEILKKSSLPPTTLLAIIRDARVEPAWNDIALPNGRSVSACRQAYGSLYARSSLQPPQPSPLGPGPVEPPRGMKRPYSSMGDASTGLPRELQPRPPAFASVNGQQIQLGPAPQPLLMSPVEPQRKKRGRPTKAEWERRQQEAQERGEVWPKPRKAKPRPSTDLPAEGSKAVAAAATAPSSSSPTRMEGFSSTGPPTAVMSPSAPPPLPPPHSQISQQGQGYHHSMEHRSADQPATSVQRPGSPTGERPVEGFQQPAQGPPAQPVSLPPQYQYGSRPPGPESPMETSRSGLQQRDALPEPQHQPRRPH